MSAIHLAITSYQTGFVGLENYFDSELISEDNTNAFFNYGINLICDGATPERLALLLEIEKMKWIKTPDSTVDDLEIIAIVEHFLKAIHAGKIDLVVELCSVILPNKRKTFHQILSQSTQVP